MHQWVLSFPMPLHFLFAAEPQLLAPLLQVIHRSIASFPIKQARLKRREADTGAVTLSLGSASVASVSGFTNLLLLVGRRR